MNNVVQKDKSPTAQRLEKQINWWKFLALSLPLIFVAGLTFVRLFGFEDLYDKLLTIGFTIFVTIGFVWWWWAIHSIASISTNMTRVSGNFLQIQKELAEIKKDINKNVE